MTINRDAQELNALLEKAIKQVKSQSIKVGDIEPKLHLTNAAAQLARCTRTRNGFKIGISKFIKDNDENYLMQALIHEVLHTVPGCFNHGFKWREVVDRMNQAFGYNISRVEEYVASNLTEEHLAVLKRYIVQCVDCEQEIYRQRRCKIIDYPEIYSCGKCGGDLKLIKEG